MSTPSLILVELLDRNFTTELSKLNVDADVGKVDKAVLGVTRPPKYEQGPCRKVILLSFQRRRQFWRRIL